MAEPLTHRQTKEAATDMFYLKPPRHISTLPKSGNPRSEHILSAVHPRADIIATLRSKTLASGSLEGVAKELFSFGAWRLGFGRHIH
jgi:hypothetical protein